MDKATLPPEAVQLLEKMHDIKGPGPVSWWPLAPGWWLLAGVGATLLAFMIYWLIRRVKQNRYRKEALSLLDTIAADPAQHSVADLNAVLKRTALHAYPRERPDIARGYGEPWVHWLNDKCKKPVINGTAARALAQGAYSRSSDAPLDELLEASRQWVKLHVSSANARLGKSYA